MPPVRSAVKRALRKRRIDNLVLLEKRNRDILFDVKCEGGTYIRSLCVDIGDALGIGAHLQELRRTEAGPFDEKDAISLHALRDSIEFSNQGNKEELKKMIIPTERVFGGWKKIIVKDSAIDAICHGAPLALPGIAELSRDIKREDMVSIFSAKQEIVATGIALLSSGEIIEKKEGAAANLDRVFMEPGTYPKSWSSKAQS